MKILLVPNYDKAEAVESGLMLELWLSRQGLDVVWAPDTRSGIAAEPDIEGCGLVISLGGDGTLLRAARIVTYREIDGKVQPQRQQPAVRARRPSPSG